MSSGEVVGPPAARASPSGQHQHRSHHSRDGSNNNNNNINITNNTTKSSSHGHRRGGRPPMIIRHGSMATTYARTEDEQFAAEHGMERPEQVRYAIYAYIICPILIPLFTCNVHMYAII